ncbi:MAG: hypothetical protein WD711_00020 [Dongiaceae bacterium]
MRFTMLAMVALVAIGVTGSAPAEDQVPQSTAGDYVPCGCGGPKAIYAAQYGTVQPPAMQQSHPVEASEQPAASADPENDTGAGG